MRFLRIYRRHNVRFVWVKGCLLYTSETVTEKDPAAAAFIVKTTQYFVPMAGKIDVEAEIGKLTESLAYYEGCLLYTSREVYVAEGLFAAVFVTRHDHAGPDIIFFWVARMIIDRKSTR